MSVIYWVRHGPTHARSFAGHRDIPADLSDADQIARLCTGLPDDALVVSSDLCRAADTATAVQGERTRLPHMGALREFDFGLWDGLPFDAVAQKWPDLSRAYWERPGDIAAPEGESWNSAAARINDAVDELLATHPGRALIVVAHFGTILTQVQRAAGITATATLAHRIDNFSVTEIQVRPTWGVARINHLY